MFALVMKTNLLYIEVFVLSSSQKSHFLQRCTAHTTIPSTIIDGMDI